MKEQKRVDIQHNFIESTNIKFGRIHKTSDEYRAIADVVSDTNRRQNQFRTTMDSTSTYWQSILSPMDTFLEEDIRKRLDGQSQEYLNTYEAVDGWVSKSFLDGEVVVPSSKQRLEYLDDLVKKAGQYSAITFIELFRK